MSAIRSALWGARRPPRGPDRPAGATHEHSDPDTACDPDTATGADPLGAAALEEITVPGDTGKMEMLEGAGVGEAAGTAGAAALRLANHAEIELQLVYAKYPPTPSNSSVPRSMPPLPLFRNVGLTRRRKSRVKIWVRTLPFSPNPSRGT